MKIVSVLSLVALMMVLFLTFFGCRDVFAASSKTPASEKGYLTLDTDTDYVVGKVNDPVSQKTQKALIVKENPVLKFNWTKSPSTIDVVVYENVFVDDLNVGVRNRITAKKVSAGESLTLLPDDLYDQSVQDGSLYDFANKCYDVRVFTNSTHSDCEDFYFGFVNDEMYAEMKDQYEKALAAEEAKKEEMIRKYGPSAASRN